MNSRYVSIIAGLGLSLAIVPLCSANAAPDKASDTFTIKLNRPALVGDSAKYSAHFFASQVSVTSQPGKEPDTKKAYREVVCLVKENVSKVSDNGKIVEERVQLDTFKGRTDESDELKPLALTGATIVATLAPEASYTRTDGKPITDEEKEYLKLVFDSVDTTSKDNEDVLFGTTNPVKIGDKWKTNEALISAGLTKASGITIPLDKMTSEMTLVSQEKIGGATYLTVNGHVDADPIQVPLQAGTMNGTMHITMTKTFPTAMGKSKGIHSSVLDLQMTAKGSVPVIDADNADIAFTMKQHKDITVLEGVKSN